MESKRFDNDSRFKTPQEIPNEKLTKAIKIGFQLNKDKKISLKEYYEEKSIMKEPENIVFIN